MKNKILILVAVVAVMCWATVAGADMLLTSGNSLDFKAGNPSTDQYAAEALFTLSGNTLTVVLTNTSTKDVTIPPQVLTALFWSSEGSPNLTPQSAILTSGSQVFFGPDGGGNVGGEWAYESALSGAPQGANEGISSSGLGIFGDPNFNGTNLQDPEAVDGLNYGLTSAGDDTATGNSKVTGGVALIQNSVTFVLTGVSPNGISIDNVSFQYGTSLGDTNLTPTPLPGAFLLLGAGLVRLAAYGRRRKLASTS